MNLFANILEDKGKKYKAKYGIFILSMTRHIQSVAKYHAALSISTLAVSLTLFKTLSCVEIMRPIILTGE